MNSTSQSFYNKFSDKEFSTLLCLRYNLDLDFIPTNLQCTCKRKNKVTGNLQPKIIDKKGFHICNACNSDGCPTIIHDAIQNVAALAFKSGGCHVTNQPVMEDLDGKRLVPDHMITGNGTHDGRSIMIDYRHTDSGQTDPFDSTSHLTKDIDGKNAQYKAVSNRNGHLFVAFVVDRFGTVIKSVQDLMFQMFKRNARNNCNEISDAEANITASRKLRFWLRRIACAMAKTKAMCIINRTDKLIRIQHEKKHGKGSKNSSAYFDNKMIEEEEMEKQIDDGTFDECAYVKDDDDLRA